MTRIRAIDPNEASGKAKELLDGVQSKLGMTPNIMRIMANSPAVLEGYLGFSGALQNGVLDPKLREMIALFVSETNGCGYCLSAHSAIGKMNGLSGEEILDSRRGFSTDSRAEAALRFAGQIVEKRGWVDDIDIARIRGAGFGDPEIAEIVANTALNIFTNYFNHAALTEVDFPPVDEL